MEKVRVYIAVEDDVTEHVIHRLLRYAMGDKVEVIMRIPAHGGQIKSVIESCNKLSANAPVVMLLDLDEGCAPALKKTVIAKSCAT